MLALYIIAGLIAFSVLLLCIPIETMVSIDTESSKKYSVIVSWLFGIIKTDLGKKRPKKINKVKTPPKKRRLLSRLDIGFTSQIGSVAGLIKRFKDLIAGIYRQLRIKEITGDLVVGFEDPVQTGMLFAIIGPANALLNLHPRYNVSIIPFFDDEDILEGKLYGNVKVQPVRLVGPVLKLATSKEARHIGNYYIKRKWHWRRKHG